MMRRPPDHEHGLSEKGFILAEVGMEPDRVAMFNPIVGCQRCGTCIIHHFDGLCPVARCAKSLLHGPCGDSSDGSRRSIREELIP